MTAPHPVVNLRLLGNRSLLAGSLFGFVLGLGLYATLYLLPVFLQSAQGRTASATGMALLPSALLSMASFLSAGPLSQKLDTRLLLFVGSVLFVAGAWGLAGLTSQSGVDDTYWPLMARGASLGFLFIPLTVASLAGLKPEQMGQGSGFINLTRQLGGSIGIAAISTLLTRRADFHGEMLVSHVNVGNMSFTPWMAQAEGALRAHGMSGTATQSGALGLLNMQVQRQALMLSFNDADVLIGLAFVVALPRLLLFKKGTATGVDAGAVHEQARPVGRNEMTAPRILLQLEGAALLMASVFAFHALHGGWLLFALLLFVPDVSMLGYLVNPRVGALCYNAVHTTLAPALLAGLFLLTGHAHLLWLCAIWLAHIGLDRMLGYGLKYPAAFKDTHLGRV